MESWQQQSASLCAFIASGGVCVNQLSLECAAQLQKVAHF